MARKMTIKKTIIVWIGGTRENEVMHENFQHVFEHISPICQWISLSIYEFTKNGH